MGTGSFPGSVGRVVFAVTLAAGVALAAPQGRPAAPVAADGAAPVAAAPAGRPAAPAREGAGTWAERVALDERLSVTAVGARQAVAALDGEGRAALEAPDARAAALLALGMARAAGERARLESVASFGPVAERRAAALALGELGNAESTLAALAADGDAEVAGAAFFGLVLSRSARAADVAQALVGARRELANEVAAIGAFATDPAGAGATADRLPGAYLDLRWRAARDYGLIDGRSWRALVLEDLAADDAFVDEVVLPSIARLRHPGARDHIATLLLDRPSPAVFAACLEALPAELERVVASKLFVPPEPTYWRRALAVIERRGPAAEDAPVLHAALREPAVARHAATLLAEVGDPAGWPWLAPDLASTDPALRRDAVRAIAASKEPDRTQELERMRRDADPGVRAAALVGRARDGERHAAEAVRDGLLGEQEERDALLEELLVARRAPRLRAMLEDHFELLEGEQRVRGALLLCLPGRIGPRDVLREALETRTAGERAPDAVRILADGASQEELDLLVELFPTGSDRELDRALAQALLEQRTAGGALFLRAALWREPWHRSVLAGLVLASQGGIHALHEELQAAPTSVGPRDLRRIGYAIGVFGGPQQVEILARRRASDDPALQGAYLGAIGSRTY